jgi:hypothetical protein
VKEFSSVRRKGQCPSCDRLQSRKWVEMTVQIGTRKASGALVCTHCGYLALYSPEDVDAEYRLAPDS